MNARKQASVMTEHDLRHLLEKQKAVPKGTAFQ